MYSLTTAPLCNTLDLLYPIPLLPTPLISYSLDPCTNFSFLFSLSFATFTLSLRIPLLSSHLFLSLSSSVNSNSPLHSLFVHNLSLYFSSYIFRLRTLFFTVDNTSFSGIQPQTNVDTPYPLSCSITTERLLPRKLIFVTPSLLLSSHFTLSTMRVPNSVYLAMLSVGVCTLGYASFAGATAAASPPPSSSTSSEGGLKIDVTHKPESCKIKSMAKDMLSMHYDGRLLESGKEFDSSRKRGQPFNFKGTRLFPLLFLSCLEGADVFLMDAVGSGQVIKGWDQGLLDMVRLRSFLLASLLLLRRKTLSFSFPTLAASQRH